MPTLATRTSVANDLLVRLNQVADSCHVDETELGQVEFQARKLRKDHPGEYYLIMGIVASLRGDVAGMQALFDEAKVATGHAADAYSNNILCLRELGMIDEAMKVYADAPDHLWRDPDFLREAYKDYYKLGLVARARALSLKFKQIGLDDPTEELDGIDRFLEDRQLGEDDIFNAVKTAMSVLCSKGKRRTKVLTRFVGSNEGNRRLTYRFTFPSDADSAFDIEQEMNDVLDSARLPAVEKSAISFYLMPSGGSVGDNSSRAA